MAKKGKPRPSQQKIGALGAVLAAGAQANKPRPRPKPRVGPPTGNAQTQRPRVSTYTAPPSGGGGGGGGNRGGGGAAGGRIGKLRATNKQLKALIAKLGKQQSAAGKKKQQGYDWLAAMTPDQLQQEASGYVHAAFDPEIEAIKQSFANQLALGGQQIQGFTGSAVNQMAPIAGQVGGFYNQAISQEQAQNQALYSEMQTGAADVGASIAEQLGKSGLNMDPGYQLGGLGAAAASTTHAIGSAGLTELLGQSAAAQTYAAQMPAVAAAQGQSDLAQFNARLGQQQADALSQLGAQIPGAIQDELNTLQEREYQKAVTRIGLKTQKGKNKTAIQLEKMRIAAQKQQAKIANQIKIWEQNQQTKRTRIQQAGANWRNQQTIAAKGKGKSAFAKNLAAAKKQADTIAKQAGGKLVTSTSKITGKSTSTRVGQRSAPVVWNQIHQSFQAAFPKAGPAKWWQWTYDAMLPYYPFKTWHPPKKPAR